MFIFWVVDLNFWGSEDFNPDESPKNVSETIKNTLNHSSFPFGLISSMHIVPYKGGLSYMDEFWV